MRLRGQSTARRRGAAQLLVCAAALLLAGCSLLSRNALAPVPAGPSATPASASTVTGDSPRVAALAYRTSVAAARGRRLTYLEYLCSVPSGRDPSTVFVAVHERTTWDSGRATLDEVLAQPVRAVTQGFYRPGPAVSIRSVRNGRLGGDAIIGLVGPDHRCSATYIGRAVTG